MLADYAAVLSAAHLACGAQHYPSGVLFLVATPIGNLADITLRALHVLDLVDLVACEDTRHTGALLRSYGIEKTPDQLLALHQHNEHAAAVTVIERLRAGQRVAYASDAGTPAISDPGARLVQSVCQAQLPVSPVPGVSSVTALLSVAGAHVGGELDGQFVFCGFLSSKLQERAAQVQALARETRAVVVLEAPHRIEALAAALAVLGQRRVTIGRELTKQFEEIANVAAADLGTWLMADSNRRRGEYALIVHPQVLAPGVDEQDHAQRVLELLLPELPLKTAVKLTAQITGAARNVLYDRALAWKARP